MQNIRLPLLLKLAIIFLAVMVVPAAIVAVYVKQQFDEINYINRLETLEYGRTSLSALLEEEWRNLFSVARSLEDSVTIFLNEETPLSRQIISKGRGLSVFNSQGDLLFDASLDCCSAEEAFRTIFQDPGNYSGYLAQEERGDGAIRFMQNEIVLNYAVKLEQNNQQAVALIQSSIGSHVFDMLRQVSDLRTSIFFLPRESSAQGEQAENRRFSGNREQYSIPLMFSTGINEYGERLSRLIVSGREYEILIRGTQRFNSEEGTRIYLNSPFSEIITDDERNEMVGILPLLVSREGLYAAELAIPREIQESPQEIEYLWVIISALFILVLLMSLLITMYVVAPIMSLNQGVDNLRKSIGSERGFEELKVESNDEIGDLAGSFNLLAGELTMSLDKIRQQRREILEYAQNLEDKVKERTREAEAARVRAEMANVHKSKFLVNMNHEFRTPLNSISGITDLLRYGAYEKNDEIALVLEELLQQVPEGTYPLTREFMEFLFEESNPYYFMLEKIREEFEYSAGATGIRDGEDSGGGGKPLDDQDESEILWQESLEQIRKLIQEEDRGKMKAYANISEGGKTLIHIVDDVINLSRIESGAIDIHPEVSSLSEIVNYVMVHSESYCRAKNKTALISLERINDPQLPEHIYIDHYRVKQILMNLMSNAVKYTERGKVVLKTRKIRREGRDFIQFIVSDEGIGIDPKDHHLLFREFGRTFNVRDIEGTGLGLAISRKLVEAHGGEVGFDSTAGKGSDFWFILPLELPPRNGSSKGD